MKRSGSLRRKTPLRTKGKPRFKKGRDPKFLAWLRTLPCLLKTWPPHDVTEAAHVRTRSAGGPDLGNTVPLCRFHHGSQHRMWIKSFQWFYEVDLKA